MTVLLEAPHRKGYNNNSVLLCVDLTKGVADEAIRRKDSVVIAYRECFHISLPPASGVSSILSSVLSSIVYISSFGFGPGRLTQNRPDHLPRTKVSDFRKHATTVLTSPSSGGYLRLFPPHSRRRRPRRPKRFPRRHMHKLQSSFLLFPQRNPTHQIRHNPRKRLPSRLRRSWIRKSNQIRATTNSPWLGAQDHLEARTACGCLHRHTAVYPALRPRNAHLLHRHLRRLRWFDVWGPRRRFTLHGGTIAS